MTETSSSQSTLSTMRLAELQTLAGQMGLKGTSRMRKSELVAAIREARGSSAPTPDPQSADAASTQRAPRRDRNDSTTTESQDAAAEETGASRPGRRRAQAAAGAPEH